MNLSNSSVDRQSPLATCDGCGRGPDGERPEKDRYAPMTWKKSIVLISLILPLAGSITSSPSLLADDWPQWRGPNRDGVWEETGIIEKFATTRLKPRWSVPIGSGYSGPTVADGRVYVTDRQTKPEEVERVLCFDWKTGKDLWKYTYPCSYAKVAYKAGPRASVLIDEGKAYALGATGHLHCLDAAKGNLIWKKDLAVEYKIRRLTWGISASPIVHGDLIILLIGGSGRACIVALDKRTGQERWRALGDRASYSAPIIIEQGGKKVLVCWTGDNVVGLDPATGKIHWRYPFTPRRMIINTATPVVSGDRLFVSSFYDGSLMLRLREDKLSVQRIWRRRGTSERKTDALHVMIGTPVFTGEHIYGVDSYGELRCLDARTGDRLWEDLTAVRRARWSTIHMVQQGERTWLFNEQGELIIAKLSRNGFEQISRAKLIDPTTAQLSQRGGVCWAHPAFAYKHVFARNDRELICTSLAAE